MGQRTWVGTARRRRSRSLEGRTAGAASSGPCRLVDATAISVGEGHRTRDEVPCWSAPDADNMGEEETSARRANGMSIAKREHHLPRSSEAPRDQFELFAGTGDRAVAVCTRGLVKDFGSTRALDHLDLSISTGEVHGFLGPNGAGKTTTLRILLGLLRKSSGDVSLLGGDPWRDTASLHRRLAYVPGETNLWPNLSGGEVIDLLADLRGGLVPARRAQLLEQFDLDPTKKCRTYSTGNRQKVALVAAFASDVELYLLDEPSSGLDPLMETEFQNIVRSVRDRGRTVLLSSHILSEVEALCDRVTIIREGRVAEAGSFDDLRHLTRTTVTVETARQVHGLDSLPGVHDVALDGTRTSLSVDERDLNRVLRHLVEFDVRHMVCAPPTLEELFLSHYDTRTETEPSGAGTGGPP